MIPTRTVYTFADTGVRIELTFFTPAFPEDLDLFSRPVTYVNLGCCLRPTARSTRFRFIWIAIRCSR